MKMKIGTKSQDARNEIKKIKKENEDEDEKDRFPFKECVLPMTDMILSNLADIFNVHRDVDSMIDPQLCFFVRTVLGL